MTRWGTDGGGKPAPPPSAQNWREGMAVKWMEGGPMWMLVIMLLNSVPGINTVTVLQTYETSEECQTERNRVGFEMAEAYPYARDFVIACQLNRKHES